MHALGVEGVAPEPSYWQPRLLVPGFYVGPHPRAEIMESAAPAGYDEEIIFPGAAS